MKKKILLLMLATSMLLGLAGCGSKENDQKIIKSEEAKEEDKAKGDGSLLPMSVTIDGVKYSKEDKVSKLLENGWTLDEYDADDIVTDDNDFYVKKGEQCLEVVIPNNEESKLALKDLNIAGFQVTSVVSDIGFVLSNGLHSDSLITEVQDYYKDVDEKDIEKYSSSITSSLTYTDKDEENEGELIGYVTYAWYTENTTELSLISINWK